LHRFSKIAVFGGVYNNYLALEATIDDARHRGVDAMFCLGDLGAFGPSPNRVFPLLLDNDILVVKGNYDDSIGRGLNNCQCGYTDPRDNHFSAISYRYTFDHTDEKWRPWLRELPEQIRIEFAGKRVLMCHGSPRKTNEFLWESNTSTQFLDRLARAYDADVILATHTGIKWKRDLADDKLFINVGVLGRPENDGKTNVWYALLEALEGDRVHVEFVPVHYDHQGLAAEIKSEGLPDEFAETILTGWWTTCLEILPAKERKIGKY